jgi:uncharacterized membrane protein YhaH (DUF805 family)
MKPSFFDLFSFRGRLGRLDYFILTMIPGLVSLIGIVAFFYSQGFDIPTILRGDESLMETEKVKQLIMNNLGLFGLLTILYFIYTLLYIWFSFSMMIMRMRDIDISLLWLIPIVLGYALLLPTGKYLILAYGWYFFLCVKSSTLLENRNGPPPERILFGV